MSTGDIVRPTTRMVLAAPVALVGVMLSLATARPEYAAVAAGPLAIVLFGVLRPAPRTPPVSLELSTRRAIEGDEPELRIRLGGLRTPGNVNLTLRVPPGLQLMGPASVQLRMGTEPQVVELPVACRRWGSYAVGVERIAVRTSALQASRRLQNTVHLTVLPEPTRLWSLISARHTQLVTGQHRATAHGAGMEFADLRRFHQGDRPRDINWRASARRSELWVNVRHPDRSADVVLLLDSVSDPGATVTVTLDAAVRAAASVADVVLRSHDRVGFVGVGGRVRWLLPGSGLRQWYRLAETLVGEQPAIGHPGLGLRVIPRGALAPDALVVALTPALDDRVTTTLVELAARGTDLVVVEIDPADLVDLPDEPAWRLARKIWDAERAGLRRRFAAAGITVVRWSPGDPFAEAIERVIRLRRRSQAGGGRRALRPAWRG